MPDLDAGAAGRRPCASAGGFDRCRLALPECRDHGVPLEGSTGAEGAYHQPRACLPEAASDSLVSRPVARVSQRGGASRRPVGSPGLTSTATASGGAATAIGPDI